MTERSSDPASNTTLPVWLWLWFPPCLLAIALVWRLVDEIGFRRLWDSEQGPVENATVLALLIGVAGGLLALRYHRALPARWLIGWLALVVAGTVYFAGEEVSWGQHWLGWTTPETLATLNDQGETNLHNMSSWFDQKPRLVLELGVIVGGLLFPLWRRWRATRFTPDGWPYWFWPTGDVVPTAVLAMAITLPARMHDLFGWTIPPPFDIREAEFQEYYFALFLAFYLVAAFVRLRARGQVGGELA